MTATKCRYRQIALDPGLAAIKRIWPESPRLGDPSRCHASDSWSAKLRLGVAVLFLIAEPDVDLVDEVGLANVERLRTRLVCGVGAGVTVAAARREEVPQEPMPIAIPDGGSLDDDARGLVALSESLARTALSSPLSRRAR